MSATKKFYHRLCLRLNQHKFKFISSCAFCVVQSTTSFVATGNCSTPTESTQGTSTGKFFFLDFIGFFHKLKVRIPITLAIPEKARNVNVLVVKSFLLLLDNEVEVHNIFRVELKIGRMRNFYFTRKLLIYFGYYLTSVLRKIPPTHEHNMQT